MKTMNKLYILAVAAFGLTACNNEGNLASYNDDPNAVHFDVQIEDEYEAKRETKVDPFVTKDPVFETGDKITVVAGKQDAVSYTLTDGEWVPETGKYLLWETEKNFKFEAYYPVTTGTSMTTFTTPDSYADEDALEAADYMTGTTTTDRVEKVSLTMERKMARAVIEVEHVNNQFDEFTINSIQMHVNSLGYKDGKVEAGPMTVTTLKHAVTENDKQVDKFYALVAPTTSDPKALLFTIEGTDQDGKTHKLEVSGILPMTAGISYTYELTVGKDKAEVTDVKVNEWGTGSVIGDGEADLVK